MRNYVIQREKTMASGEHHKGNPVKTRKRKRKDVKECTKYPWLCKEFRYCSEG